MSSGVRDGGVESTLTNGTGPSVAVNATFASGHGGKIGRCHGGTGDGLHNAQYPNFGSGKKADANTVTEIRELLGQRAVLIPVGYEKKIPTIKGWQRLSGGTMENPDHLAALAGGNIGVLLGSASDGLVSIDFDTEESATEFRRLNGVLADTLTTAARRGLNLWYRVISELPRSCKIKTTGGADVGEVRANGNQTIIHGRHPLGANYRAIKLAKPRLIEWSDLQWPASLVVGAPPLTATERIVEQYGDFLTTSVTGAVGVNQPALVAKFVEEHPIKFCPGRGYYEYDPTTGIWKRVSTALVKTKLCADLAQLAKEASVPSLRLKLSDSFLRSLVGLLEGQAEHVMKTARRDDVLHFSNGMLVIDGGEPQLKPFGPEYFSINGIPFPYKAEAECPRFMAMLEQAFGVSNRQLLLKWLGVALTGKNFPQKILLLTGIGGAGKGVLVDIIKAIVGISNCEQLRTAQLNSRFELSRFIDKTLLIGADVPGDFLNLKGADTLKSLTGGDLLSTESKGINGSAELKGEFNVVITSNKKLRVRLDDDRAAWRRRILKIDFQKIPERANPRLASEIIESEASGIINKALMGLSLVRRGFVEHGKFLVTPAQQRSVDDLLDESDSIVAFLKSEVASDTNGDVTAHELHDAYRKFCDGKGWVEQPQRIFQTQLGQQMLEIFSTNVRNDIPRHNHHQRGYRGVTVKGSTDEFAT